MLTPLFSVRRAIFASAGLFALSMPAVAGPIPPIAQAPAAAAQLPVIDVQCGPLGCGPGPRPGVRPPVPGQGPGYGPRPPYNGNRYYRRNYWPRYYEPDIYFDFYVPSYRYVQPRRYYRDGRFSPAHIEWCYDRYRSYRDSDNTYQPYHGLRRQCYSPYW